MHYTGLRRRVLSPSAGDVSICADARIGGPLAIEACNAGVQVPCVGDGTARIRLESRHAGGTPTAPPTDTASDAGGTLRPVLQPQQRTFEIVQSPISLTAAPLAGLARPVDLCQEWRQAAGALSSWDAGAAEPVIAVVGSKQTGKSTFARLLVNSLLNRAPLVAYLDTDCGQSEFTAPGGQHTLHLYTSQTWCVARHGPMRSSSAMGHVQAWSLSPF